jgi:ribosomal protein L37AE/L43A
MSTQEVRNTETINEAAKYKKNAKSLMRATLHCPLCNRPAKRYATTYYCEECNVDFDESKRLFI